MNLLTNGDTEETIQNVKFDFAIEQDNLVLKCHYDTVPEHSFLKIETSVQDVDVSLQNYAKRIGLEVPLYGEA